MCHHKGHGAPVRKWTTLSSCPVTSMHAPHHLSFEVRISQGWVRVAQVQNDQFYLYLQKTTTKTKKQKQTKKPQTNKQNKTKQKNTTTNNKEIKTKTCTWQRFSIDIVCPSAHPFSFCLFLLASSFFRSLKRIEGVGNGQCRSLTSASS